VTQARTSPTPIAPASGQPTHLSADVLVIGGGNAALCAALSAADAGASVLVLERAPRAFRGGNSRHTRDVRFAHGGSSRYAPGEYASEEFLDDLLRVTGGRTDESLARLIIERSSELPHWMEAHGVRWQRPLRGTLHLARTNAFMLGGGTAMLNAYYVRAERLRVAVYYDAQVVHLNLDSSGRFVSADATICGTPATVTAAAVVVASGGFEANLPWLSQYWGEAATNFIVRGSPFNTGEVLADLLALGAQPVGDPREFHAIAVDGRAPKFDGGIVTRLDSVPFGIVVNKLGQRFYDEGEDFWPKRYAIWGGLIARQPGQVAYSIVDSKTIDRFMPSVFPAIESDSIEKLGVALGLPSEDLAATVLAFNDAVVLGRFDPSELDDCLTIGLGVPKSHWALPLDTPPFFGYPLRPGITFTYLGVRVDTNGRVLMHHGAADNIFAAGEIMAGNVLRKGYLAGFGLTIGCVYGRITGEEAAAYAR
jgi:tricarballylate dehydrogenase